MLNEEKSNILFRAKSFLQAHNLKAIDEARLGKNLKKDLLTSLFDVAAPITIPHLDRLYFYTIYNADGPFSLIDFLMESSVSSSEWMESKLAPSADQIEAHFKNLISNSERKTEESEFLEKWIKRQPQGKPVDSDLLALRTLETLILMAIVRFQRDDPEETREPAAFKILEERLMDWSEAAGLIRSLSSDNPQSALMAETSMDVDFNPNAETSTLFTLNPNEFDIYLLFKFKAKGFRRFKEIAEIVADRCGIPVDSDLDDPMAASAAAAGVAKDQQQTKHWRRVKPESLPIKRVASAKVTRPSSLSVTDLKSTRFLSSTSSNSSRQVDLTVKQHSFEVNRRRTQSETQSEQPQIIQQTTPTKSKKSFNFAPNAAGNSFADYFVILETPPRALSRKAVLENDLTGSVRRLFPSMEEEE